MIGLVLASALAWPAATEQPPAPLRARWLGQDGRDYVGPYPEAKPNDVQDVHLRISGLPARRALRTATLSGKGGDRWHVAGPPGSWPMHWIQPLGSTAADVYFEPFRVETGREFQLELEFQDGGKAELYFAGGKADPGKAVGSATASATWRGQGKLDEVGANPGVGPDGFADVRIDLDRLSPKRDLAAIAIDPEKGPGWLFGRLPSKPDRPRGPAELLPVGDDRRRAVLLFQPDRDLEAVPLSLTFLYADGSVNRVKLTGGRCEPRKAIVAKALPKWSESKATATWLGLGKKGYAQVRIDGLPAGRAIAAAVLTDAVRGCWSFAGPGGTPPFADEGALPLEIRHEGGSVVLGFRPIRDESDTWMTLRLIGAEGRFSVLRFAGGACDPTLAAEAVSTHETTSRPGDDLSALVARGGTIRLQAGVYELDRPLILDRPCALIGQGQVELRFRQRPEASPWSAAITLAAGRTTLEGFAVRCAGPIRWDHAVSYGPAVIGTNSPVSGPLVGLRLARLDLRSPEATQPGTWQEAIRLMRLVAAEEGAIVENRLCGGPVEMKGGPWLIRDNVHTGTPAFTTSPNAFAVHHAHDVVIERNRAEAVAPGGKVWRFLVLTQRGSNVRISGNEIKGLGPRDDDPLPHPNAPEVILTESYRLHFEGRPRAVTTDGRIVAVGEPPGGPAPTGALVAILKGPDAGRWRTVLQAIDARTYLVDPPLPSNAPDLVIALASGFSGVEFRDNRLDLAGSKQASGLVLAGNHFGTHVIGNSFVGGAEPFRLLASATERPRMWGWSHAPMLGLKVRDNRSTGSALGGRIAVEHGPKIGQAVGRTYFTVELSDNRLDRLRLGGPGSLDAGELKVTERPKKPGAAPR